MSACSGRYLQLQGLSGVPGLEGPEESSSLIYYLQTGPQVPKTAPKNQSPGELSTTRQRKVLPLIRPQPCLLQWGVLAQVLPRADPTPGALLWVIHDLHPPQKQFLSETKKGTGKERDQSR